MDTKKKSFLPDINNNFSEWYLDVIYYSGLAENSSVKGCIIILPYGYALWENIQCILNKEIKSKDVKNMAFPLLIPYSYFEKEISHVEGFAPEVALVTSAGGKKLEDPLVVRPTSEVIIHEYFKNTIQSWRDLPLKVNQWCSVVRWEKRPRPFIRTTEFWWQEGHTAHATVEEAENMALEMINVYATFCKDFLAIPVFVGKKPQDERFAGAEITWTIEGMMKDGKAVQMGTSHVLGNGFVDAIGIEFQDKNQSISKPTLTSWGVTTRLIGTIAMVHGDQKGLIMPPFIAPILIGIIPIYKNNEEKELVFSYLCRIEKALKFMNNSRLFNDREYTFEVDYREELTPGEKFNDFDLRGIPFRIDLGARDLRGDTFTFYSRFDSKKNIHSVNLISDPVLFKDFLDSNMKLVHDGMYNRALAIRVEKIIPLRFIDAINNNCSKVNEVAKNNFYVSYWCGVDYIKIKDMQLTVRCIMEEDFMQKDFSSDDKICCVHKNKCQNLQKCILAKCY